MIEEQVYKWMVRPVTSAFYRISCNKCNKITLFRCSNKFRINAQGKNVDVWLIYKCQKCSSTRNISIYTRKKPSLIDKNEFQAFQNNSHKVAKKYSFDKEVIRQNKLKVDYGSLELEISGDVHSLNEIAEKHYKYVVFEINSKYQMDIKLSRVIRKSMRISLKQMKDMLDLGIISTMSNAQAEKCKLRDGEKVIIDCEKLKAYVKMRP